MKSAAPQQAPEMPARLASGNFLPNRHLTKTAGGPMGWSRIHILEIAHGRGQLTGSDKDDQKARNRLNAGLGFHTLYEASQFLPGRDSTALEAVSGSKGGDTASATRIDATRRLRALKDKMGLMDAQLVEMLCGEQQEAAEVIRKLFGADYKFTVWARVREGIDALIRAGG